MAGKKKQTTNPNEKIPMQPKDWERCKMHYLRGDSLEEILKEFKGYAVTKNTIMNTMSRDGVIAKKKALDERVLDHAADKLEQHRIDVNNKCIELFNNGTEIINLLLKQYLNEAKSGENIPKTRAKATAYNIDLLMSGITKAQKGLRVAYGMDEVTGKLFEKEPEILIVDGLDVGKI